ncbi:hypothetical protein BDQ17DRAFT_1348727 [Cyathus striatus]|nr:hypothetical protein BDQ17DRAFT_1348727 [Cyathus striatus]
MLRLYLSSMTPLNSLYSTEDKRVLYKVTSSKTLWSRLVVIERITPGSQPTQDEKHFLNVKTFQKRRLASRLGELPELLDTPPRAGSVTFMDPPSRASLESRAVSRIGSGSPLLYPSMDGATDEPLAKLKFPMFKSARIQFKGSSIDPTKLFSQQGWSWFGKTHIFIAPDGRQYKWSLGRRAPQLSLNDATQAPVARFRPSRKGFLCFGKETPGILQIYPAGMHIIDLVFMTFIYVEKIRRRRELVARFLGEW